MLTFSILFTLCEKVRLLFSSKTFIDSIIQIQFRKKNILTIFFHFFSTERVWMVQTETQYICIHQCLLTVLEGKENTNPITATHVNQGYDGKFTLLRFEILELVLNRHVRRYFFVNLFKRFEKNLEFNSYNCLKLIKK